MGEETPRFEARATSVLQNHYAQTGLPDFSFTFLPMVVVGLQMPPGLGRCKWLSGCVTDALGFIHHASIAFALISNCIAT